MEDSSELGMHRANAVRRTNVNSFTVFDQLVAHRGLTPPYGSVTMSYPRPTVAFAPDIDPRILPSFTTTILMTSVFSGTLRNSSPVRPKTRLKPVRAHKYRSTHFLERRDSDTPRTSLRNVAVRYRNHETALPVIAVSLKKNLPLTVAYGFMTNT